MTLFKTTDIRNAQGELLDHSFHPGNRTNALVILGHGVTGNKDRPLLVALASGLSAKGWPCLRLSYAGNGASEGQFTDCTITKEVADLTAVLSCVPDNVKIIYAGHSMGGAVGVLTASRDPRIHILVSLAGMTYTRAFATREFGDVTPDKGLMWDDPDCPLSQKFMDDMVAIDNTLTAAAHITQPWLLIHGHEDDVVPISDGEAAYHAAQCHKSWVPIEGAGHAFGEESYPALITAINNWINQNLA